MTSANVREADYLKSWAVFFALSFLGGTIAGALTGGLAGGVLGALGAPRGLVATVSGGLGFLVSLPISYFSFRFAVAKFLLQKQNAAAPVVEPLKAAA